MSTVERLRTILTALNLTAVDARLESLLETASKKEPAYADFLLEVVSHPIHGEHQFKRPRPDSESLKLSHIKEVFASVSLDSSSC